MVIEVWSFSPSPAHSPFQESDLRIKGPRREPHPTLVLLQVGPTVDTRRCIVRILGLLAQVEPGSSRASQTLQINHRHLSPSDMVHSNKTIVVSILSGYSLKANIKWILNSRNQNCSKHNYQSEMHHVCVRPVISTVLIW